MPARSPKIATYEEFWPHYLTQHLHPVNRLLHVLGTTSAILLLLFAPIRSLKFALVAPLPGYGCAWIGHALFELNSPTTFNYPFWSLRSDLRMTMQVWRRMSLKIEKPSQSAKRQRLKDFDSCSA